MANAICCPKCGALESPTAAACHRCGRPFSQAYDALVYIRHLLKADDLVTSTLQILLVAGFVLTVALTVRYGGAVIEAFGPDEAFHKALFEMGALSSQHVIEQPWRLVSALFLHGGILHLFFNFSSLAYTGRDMELVIGRRNVLVVYLIAGVAGNLASLGWASFVNYYWYPRGLFQVGASGAICGLLSAQLTTARFRADGQYYRSKRAALSWIALTLIFGWLVPFIDTAAHIGGMIAGGALALVFIRTAK